MFCQSYEVQPLPTMTTVSRRVRTRQPDCIGEISLCALCDTKDRSVMENGM